LMCGCADMQMCGWFECWNVMSAKQFSAVFHSHIRASFLHPHIRTSAHPHINTYLYIKQHHMSRRLERWEKIPVYKKAQELFDLAEVIAESLKEDEMKEHLAVQMLSNAAMVQAKIAGAEGGGLYSLRMQNAVLIKLAVQDMFNAVSFSSMVEINEEDYVDLMRDKVDEFRLVFNEWVRGFDKTYDIPDNWAIRFDTSTPEQEKLEDLMFDEDRFFNEFEDDFDEDEDEPEEGE
jgi:hypothetical protein